MKRNPLQWIILIVLLAVGMQVQAIGVSQVDEYTGSFQQISDEVLVVLDDLNAGDVIYIYAAGVGFVDTYVYILDDAELTVFAEDDNSGGGYNAALSYTVETAGTYKIGLITTNQVGEYRMRVGINTPEVLESTADEFAAPLIGDFDCSQAVLGDRPVLSGDILTRDGETFRIHYTVTGRDATTEGYIDVLYEALNRSLTMQFDELGWSRPPDDCGEGGDSRLDIYVQDISRIGASGIARRENVVGDNPYTEATEFYAAYSYLIIENDMGNMPRGRAYQFLRTTAAHEVHHNIQFGYDVNDDYFGFYEAGASWIETLVYPTFSDAHSQVDDVFEQPDVCMGRRSRRDLRIYGEWVMIDSFARDLGARSYQYIWETMAQNEGLEGFYQSLADLGTTPQDIISRMAVRNLLRDYALGDTFDSTVRLDGTIREVGFVRPRRNGVQQLAVDYVEVRTPAQYTFQLQGDENLHLYAVGIHSNTRTAQMFDLGRGGTLDATQFSYTYLIILNTAQHSNFDECEYTDWSLQVFDGSGNTPNQPSDEIWSANNFAPPR